MSSPNHDHLGHLRISFEEIRSATNNFDEKRIIHESGYEKIYWGELLWSGDELIEIRARRWLNKDEWDDEKQQQFWMEIFMLSSLKHKNLASLVGFCDENDEKIIICKLEIWSSLDKRLSDSTLLTWVRRLRISVGVAKALSYIHHDETRDFSVIHRNISSTIVFYNDICEAKLFGFEYSMKVTASERHLSFDTDKVYNNPGYTDPTYIETKRANHKSDIYSFGVVLFELLCGRKTVIDDDQDYKYLVPLAITHFTEKTLSEIIDWNLWKQMDLQSFNIFAEIAFDCLNDERSRRPNIDEIVTRLEKAQEIQLQCQNEVMSSLAHLKIPLENILHATNNFAGENLIALYGNQDVYKGKLLWSGDLIDITARRLRKWNEEFRMEVSLLSGLKHKNLVSLVGFCDENDQKVIIYRHHSMGMLNKYLDDPMSMTWIRRLEICVGLAHALSYIHYDKSRDFSIIHRKLCSHTVVLTDDWEPKLYFFKSSIKIKASQRDNSFLTKTPKYVNGYGDPTYIETKRVSHKSDIYSFGILLFELLCGRESIIKHPDNKYLAPVAIFHYEKKILDNIIDPDLWKQIDPKSFNVFSKTAYNCLHEERSQRSSIYEIVTKLEKALELQLKSENVAHSSAAAEVEGISFDREKGSVTLVSTGSESQVSKKSFLKDPSLLKLSFEELKSATNSFDKENKLNESGSIFKGRLLRSEQLIDILVKGYRSASEKDESKMFRAELSMLSSLKHKNLVSLIGFFEDAEKEVKAIIYKREANGSLEKYLSDPYMDAKVEDMY